MISEPLSLWGQGAVTLPKKWREQYDTKHYMAVETAEGLLIKPIMDAVYYEKSESEFGVVFPTGISPQSLLQQMENFERREEKSRRLKKS